MQLNAVLGIETATRNCSVAVVSQEKVLAEYNVNTGNNHGSHLMPLIEKALSDCNLKLNDVSGIAVSTGPGSFTGLRIGIATAKGLGLASEKPVIGIPTLDGLAYNVCSLHTCRGSIPEPGQEQVYRTRIPIRSARKLSAESNFKLPKVATVCPLLDAHREEVYSALYKYSGEPVFDKMTPYMVLPLEELLEKITETTIFLGDINPEIIEKKLGDRAIFAPPELNQPKAISIAYLGILHSVGVTCPPDGRRGFTEPATAFTPANPPPSTTELKPIYLRKARAEEELPITLDEMREEDIPQVMEIERESFPSPWSETMFKNRDRSIFLVARLRGRIIGYAAGFLMTDELHLGNIAVHKDFRGRRIAKKLLQRIIEIARSKKVRLITLEARAGNIPAQNLYRKFGFKTAGRRKGYYQDRKEDAIIMTLILKVS